MTASTPRSGTWARVWALLLLGAAAVALFTLARAPRSGAFEEDERDYLRAAANLARFGVFSHAPLAATARSPDAYREPAYSALVAASWRLAGCPAPANESQLDSWFIPDTARAALPAETGTTCAARATRTANLLLFGFSMAAAAAAARLLGAGVNGALLAALLTGLSPALRLAAHGLYSENLAAPLFVGGSIVVALARIRPSAARIAAAALVAGVAPLARSALVVLPLAGTLLLALRPGRSGAAAAPLGPRLRRAALFLALSLLPLALWVVRNSRQTGQAVIADTRGVFLIRSELDAEIGAEGALAAFLAWTPLESARALGRELRPEAHFDRYRWTGDGNFATRAMRRWHEARAAKSAAEGGALAADRELARGALREFARHPLDHARATAAVAWRGLFAERSPALPLPFDFGLPIGLALLAAFGAAFVASVRSGDSAALALLAPAILFFVFHALATEFLPRFAIPALPLAWAAMAALVDRRWTRSRRPTTG